MDLGVHLPLMQFGEERLSLGRLGRAVDAARECGFAAVSANDHFVFQTAWLDGPTALASMFERSGRLTLATTLCRGSQAVDHRGDGGAVVGVAGTRGGDVTDGCAWRERSHFGPRQAA